MAVAACGAALALALGLVLRAGLPPGGGAARETGIDVDPALAAIAPDVAGRPWLARRAEAGWIWGRAGSRERNALPAGESGLAIGDRWLASAVSTPAATRVRIRDLATGAVVVERQLDFRASAAVFAGDQLLVTGYLGPIAGADGGIVALRVPGGQVRTLVASGAFPARLGDGPSKGDFHLSGDGALAAVNTCGAKGCDNVVIDLASLEARVARAAAPGFLRAIAGDALVLTDADGAWIKGVDARTGRETFTVAGASLMEPASMADGRIIGSVGGGARGWRVAAIDRRGGLTEVTAATSAPGPWVWPNVSSPTVAVLGDVPFEAALGDGAARPNRLIRGADLRDLGTLVVQPAG